MAVTQDMMEKLFKTTVLELTKKIESGDATPTDLATAARLCKEHGMEVEFDDPEEELLPEDVPSFESDNLDID